MLLWFVVILLLLIRICLMYPRVFWCFELYTARLDSTARVEVHSLSFDMFSLRQWLTGSANREVCWTCCITLLAFFILPISLHVNLFSVKKIAGFPESSYMSSGWCMFLRLIFILVWQVTSYLCAFLSVLFSVGQCLSMYLICGTRSPCRLNSDFVLFRLLSGIPVT